MRILVTGATGVIGRRLVPRLLAQADAVTAVGHAPGKRPALEKAGARVLSLDLFDRGAVERAVDGHDAIINLATHLPTGYRTFLPGAWRENDRIRREASANLVAAARQAWVPRFIQESFAPIYADHGVDWIDENQPLQPSRYNRSLLDAEASAQHFTDTGGDGIVLRFALFYGPDSSFVIDLIHAVQKGRAPLPGSGDAFLSSVSHDDAASAVLAALRVPAGVYNVVDDEPLPRRDFVGSLAGRLGVPPPRLLPAWLTPLLGSIGEMLSRSLRISNHKLRAASGWAPQWRSVREGWPPVLDTLGIGRHTTVRSASREASSNSATR